MGLFKSIGKIFSGIGKAISGIVKAVVSVVTSVIDFVLQPFMGLFGAPDVGANEAQRQDGVLIQRQGSNVNIPVIYGMRRVGGIVTYAETGSTNNQYLWVAYVLGEGPVEGLRELFIDDFQIPNNYVQQAMAGLGNVVSIGDGKYKDRVQFQFFPGYFYEEGDIGTSVLPDRTLMDAAPGWKDTMYYNGMAVLFVRYYWKKIETQADADSNPFSGNIPQIKATILGRKVQTLITGSDWSTYGTNERYSTNPAECLADYLRNPRYGKGLVNADLDWTTFQKAALKCNQEVEYITDTFGPIMTCNAVVDTAQTLFNNTKSLLAGFRAYMPFVQGKYKLKIEDAGDPDDILSGVATIQQTFTQDNIQGNVTFTGIPRNGKYNAVAVTYVDPDNKYSTQQVVYPETETERQAYIDIDGGRENKTEVTFGTITNYAMAKDFARMIFNKSREQETCSLRVSSQALELEPGDNIRIQSNILDFSTDPWRIVSLKYNDDMTIDLGCVRNPDSIYPHTRVGEEDVVIPPFIPKGATIYYPTSQNNPLVGLIPPTHVPGYNETDPNTSAGGGVGNPNGSVNSGDDVDPPEEVPLDLIDVVEFVNVKWESTGGLQNRGIFTFTAPDHAMFDGIDVYWKTQSMTGYQNMSVTTTNGPANDFQFTIDSMIHQTIYNFTIRVKYTSGEYSQNVLNFSTAPNDTTQIFDDDINLVGDGWSPPRYEPVEIRNNVPTAFKCPVASPVGSARRLTMAVKQNVVTEAPNDQIKGLQILWKPVSSAYWYKNRWNFQQDYKPGDVGTFTFDGDIGSSGDPTQYDFIFRFSYWDGTKYEISQKQVRFMNVDVTDDSSGWSIFLPANFDGDLPSIELVGDYSAPLIEENQGAITNPEELTLPLKTIVVRNTGVFGNTPTVTIQMEDSPTSANNVYLRGFRAYGRPYDPFKRGNEYVLMGETTLPEATMTVDTFLTDVTKTYEHEFVIVPLVRDGSSTIEADNAWYVSGVPNYKTFRQAERDGEVESGDAVYIGSDPTPYINYKDAWNPTLVNKYEALNTVQTVKNQTDPTVQIMSFQMVPSGNTAWKGNTGTNVLNAGYKLVINASHIGVSFSGVRIYRRVNNTENIIASEGNYYGKGVWEYFDVNYTSYSTDRTIWMKPPPYYVEYDKDGNASSFYNSTNGYPIAAPTGYDEFIVVVKQSGTPEDVGILLRGAFYKGGYTATNCAQGALTTVALSDYDSNIDSARTITNAISARANSALRAVGSGYWFSPGNPTVPINAKGIGVTAALNGGSLN